MARIYGLVPDTHDPRDLGLHHLAAARRVTTLPPAVDYGALVPAVMDQGAMGKCVGCAAGHYGRGYLLNRDGQPYHDSADQWLYEMVLLREHRFGQDVGSQPRDALRVLRNIGIPPLRVFPDDPARFIDPLPDLHVEAHPWKITGFYRLLTPLDVKVAFAAGAAIIVGLEVRASFEALPVDRTGIVPMPGDPSVDPVVGYHEAFLSGYDDGTQRWRLVNSWGTQFGNQGYYTLPYGFLSAQAGGIGVELADVKRRLAGLEAKELDRLVALPWPWPLPLPLPRRRRKG